jgi:hypothetical protein
MKTRYVELSLSSISNLTSVSHSNIFFMKRAECHIVISKEWACRRECSQATATDEHYMATIAMLLI